MSITLPILLSLSLTLDPAAFAPWQSDIDRFERSIQAFEELDRTEEYADDAILFVGSSSIRLWKTLAEDMAPYSVIQRGYGGARFSDLAYFADRIISPHEYQALVIFVGNDVSGSDRDKTPEQTVAFFQHVLDVVRKKKPDVPVFLIAVTPTARRWEVWPEIQGVNSALRAACDKAPHTYFISTARKYLDKDGLPRTELFVEDNLHLNREGYRRWTSIIKPVLNDVLPPAAEANR
jgi:lysophospholipase L1-like esterase